MNGVSLIIVAGGRSTRMGTVDKQFSPLCGKPLLQYSIEAFLDIPDIGEIILVLSAANLSRGAALMTATCGDRLPHRVVCGGVTRQESVRAGFSATNPALPWVAIHDGARPLVQQEQILAVLAGARQVGAAILGVPVKDTLKRASLTPNSPGASVTETVPRADLFSIQTPQVFARNLYAQAMAFIETTQEEFTDDCSIIERLGHPVQLIPGAERNLKVTTQQDLPLAAYYLSHQNNSVFQSDPTPPKQHSPKPPLLRVGQGYDVHRLVPGRPLILGGVTISHPMGLLGHSDADVLIHAVMDALLGAAALGDIGQHFPDTDAQFKNKNSLRLLVQVMRLLDSRKYQIANIDATIIAQEPKLAPFLPEMEGNISRACKILPEQVNIKATTEERLGFTGEKQGMSASAVALLYRHID